jgi:hypothetical protein
VKDLANLYYFEKLLEEVNNDLVSHPPQGDEHLAAKGVRHLAPALAASSKV